MIRPACLILISLALGACAPADAPPLKPEPAAEVSASDGEAGIQLTLATDRTEITTLDRVNVTITLRRPVANTVTLIEPDWEAAGWTRIDATDTEPIAVEPDIIERSRTVTVEPFLAGDYTVPPATIQWTTGQLTRVLETPDLTVIVASVLAESDTTELAAPESAILPEPEQDDHTFLPLIISIAVLAGALLLINAARRPSHRDDEPTPADVIRALANNTHESDTPLADLHRALAQAEPMPSSKARLNELIARCEVARFAPDASESDRPNPQQVAATALELIVTDPIDPDPAHPNSDASPIGGAA